MRRPAETLANLDTLILDEAGMMSGEMLQALDSYITLARKGAISKRKAELTEVCVVGMWARAKGAGPRGVLGACLLRTTHGPPRSSVSLICFNTFIFLRTANGQGPCACHFASAYSWLSVLL